jgi:glycerol kinase
MSKPSPTAQNQPPYLLVLDQGTTSTRAILYNASAQPLAQSQLELPQHFPNQGWVEHDAEQIWQHSLQCLRNVLVKADVASKDVAGLGITNQRETVVLWERKTGRPLHHALVWQDRRSADHCQQLREQGAEAMVTQKTGLLLDPYFSATKLAWLLENVSGARAAASNGDLAAGTVDSFLVARLTGLEKHITDATNASRTLLYNIHELQWDDELLSLFQIPQDILPQVTDSIGKLGTVDDNLLGAPIPIFAIAGDQQAAAYGQGCRRPGMMKSTYGTGCFTLLHCGDQVPQSKNRLLATIALMENGACTYALEGSIFNAGTTVQWLRDQAGFLTSASESEQVAVQANPNSQVMFVPAFTGLGAPHWSAHARGSLFGLCRDTTPADIVRAGLEAVAWQTFDLLEATSEDIGSMPEVLKIDGGMAQNNWFAQFLADAVHIPIQRPQDIETTALGACLMAGKGAGIFMDETDLAACWRKDRTFLPSMEPNARNLRLQRWRLAVDSVVKIADNLRCLA